jgi:Mg-chelatase subunit ChlD
VSPKPFASARSTSAQGFTFFPPELASQAEFEGLSPNGDLQGADELLRERYFRRIHGYPANASTDRELVALILEKARRIVSHPTRPTFSEVLPYTQAPFEELALEESLDEDPTLDAVEALRVERQRERRVRCVAMLDTSSSMAGEKHLLASVAVAVLLLEMPPEDAGLCVFSTGARVVRRLGERKSAQATVLDFLRTTPKGFTDISLGLRKGHEEAVRSGSSTRSVGILVSDGRSTEGDDPLPLARRFRTLVVLHLDGPGSDLAASQALAQAGGGTCLVVDDFADLPRRLYDAVRLVLRR